MTHSSRHTSLGWFSSLAVIILGTAFAAGCCPDPSKMIEEAKKVNSRFEEAFKKEDTEAIMALYWKSPDVTLMPIDAMKVKGHGAIRAGFEKFFEGTNVKSFKFSNQEYLVLGDSVLGSGTFKLVTDPEFGPETAIKGRYTDVVTEKDGEWVYVFDHASLPVEPGKSEADSQAAGKKPKGGSGNN